MGKLNTNLNELSKDPATQLAQLNLMGNDIINWSQNLQSAVLVDYNEPATAATIPNESNSTTNYTQLKNFIFTFVPNNALVTVNLHLYISGEGYLGLFFNGLLTGNPIYFNNNPSPQLISYQKKIQLSTNTQKLAIQWKSSSNGSKIQKWNTTATPGNNSIQISSENS